MVLCSALPKISRVGVIYVPAFAAGDWNSTPRDGVYNAVLQPIELMEDPLPDSAGTIWNATRKYSGVPWVCFCASPRPTQSVALTGVLYGPVSWMPQRKI